MSTRTFRKRSCLRARVNRDDARLGEGAEHLDGHVTQPADTDHHGRAAGHEMGHRMLDGVVGRQAGVGQRSRRNRVQIADRDQKPLRGNGDVLSETAVTPQPAAMRSTLLGPFTDVLHALCTPPAGAATPRAVDDHRLALAQPGDARSERGDVAGVFVP